MYFVLGFQLTLFAAHAQQSKLSSLPLKPAALSEKLSGPLSTYSVTIDTLKPASVMPGGCAVGTNTTLSGFYITPLTVIAANHNDSGYVFGTNLPGAVLGTSGTSVTKLAQRYRTGSAAVTVSNVLVVAGVATGSVTSSVASIYSETSGNGPGAQLGTSSTAVPMASYFVNSYTSYTFPSPVQVPANTNFFASITIPAFGGSDHDTLAILNTNFGCSSVDSLLWMYVASTNTTVPSGWQSLLGLTGGSLNADLLLFPIVDFNTTGINTYIAHGDLTLYPAYPNPTNHSLNILFSLEKTSDLNIELYDVTGKKVKSLHVDASQFSSGKNTVSLDVSDLESGSYIYAVQSGSAKLFSKFVLNK